MTEIVCIADLHEHLVAVPACDLLVIAGDVSFAGKGDLRAKHAFLTGPFKDWLEDVPAEEIVLVAGNHDQSIEAWGIPDGPWFLDWAFNAPRRYGEAFLASKFDLIPDATDIVVGHGPPRGYGDGASRPGGVEHVGSTAMTEALQRVQPPLMVCGHIHSAYGSYRLDDTEVVNAALVDDGYRPVNGVVQIEL
jgi:Icc-related predicted phosphoesterase